MSYPAPFPAPKVPLTVIFDSIPKFDGSTLGFDWLDTFNDVCEYFDLTPHWKIKNVERVLEGRAATWWAGRKLDFKSNLTQENSICKFALFSQLFTSYFNQAEIRSQAKLDLLKISYTSTANPSDYVNQKLALIATMDPNMSNPKKLKYLMLGLPSQVHNIMISSLNPDSTPTEFETKLKFVKQQLLSQNPALTVPPSTPNPADYYKNNPPPPVQPSSQLMPLIPITTPTPSRGPPNPNTTPCWYCGHPRHTMRRCVKHAKDFNLAWQSAHTNGPAFSENH